MPTAQALARRTTRMSFWAQVRYTGRSVGAVVVALYVDRYRAVQRRHIGLAQVLGSAVGMTSCGSACDRAGIEPGEIAGIAQVIANELERIAAVLGLLIGALDRLALTAVAGEQRDERREMIQADGDGHHQLDDRVSPRACRIRAVMASSETGGGAHGDGGGDAAGGKCLAGFIQPGPAGERRCRGGDHSSPMATGTW